MSLANKKKILMAGFVSIAAVVVMASCANDTSNNNTTEQTSSADTASLAGPDSATKTKATVVRKKKGKASAAFSADNKAKVEKGKDGVYSRADQMPEYPGGESALSNFVENHISYPQDAIDQNTEGTVIVSFVIDEKGKVANPVVTGKSMASGLDNEAVKVVQQMPAWKPGMVKGKPVKTRLSLPVTFKLDA
jgi:protein TonB